MADSAANLAMDTRTSTQVHFPTHRAAFNNLTQDLDNDVMHWLMRSSEDPRSLDNTRQPHIGPREHAILVKDYLAMKFVMKISFAKDCQFQMSFLRHENIAMMARRPIAQLSNDEWRAALQQQIDEKKAREQQKRDRDALEDDEREREGNSI
ncbi:hypothetical protein FI667_g16252, partial [Globisporangium splendens]